MISFGIALERRIQKTIKDLLIKKIEKVHLTRMIITMVKSCMIKKLYKIWITLGSKYEKKNNYDLKDGFMDNKHHGLRDTLRSGQSSNYQSRRQSPFGADSDEDYERKNKRSSDRDRDYKNHDTSDFQRRKLPIDSFEKRRGNIKISK